MDYTSSFVAATNPDGSFKASNSQLEALEKSLDSLNASLILNKNNLDDVLSYVNNAGMGKFKVQIELEPEPISKYSYYPDSGYLIAMFYSYDNSTPLYKIILMNEEMLSVMKKWFNENRYNEKNANDRNLLDTQLQKLKSDFKEYILKTFKTRFSDLVEYSKPISNDDLVAKFENTLFGVLQSKNFDFSDRAKINDSTTYIQGIFTNSNIYLKSYVFSETTSNIDMASNASSYIAQCRVFKVEKLGIKRKLIKTLKYCPQGLQGSKNNITISIIGKNNEPFNRVVENNNLISYTLRMFANYQDGGDSYQNNGGARHRKKSRIANRRKKITRRIRSTRVNRRK